jgi:Protein of unknown function (DUF1615)
MLKQQRSLAGVKLRRFLCALLVATLSAAPTVHAETIISVDFTTQLVRNAARSVIDPRGWAIDLHDVLQSQSLAESKENICAAIAVIAQESGFATDPVVQGLGKLSETALREKFDKIPIGGKVALTWLENNPTPSASFMVRIRSARTERDLDLAYRALVEYAGKSTNMDALLRLGLLNTLIEQKNEIDTAGSMQVSVKFAIDDVKSKRWLPMSLDDVYAVRDQLYTRRGGIYFGVKQLLDYDTGYGQKIFRFADYNAGRYASRNAALQIVISKLSNTTLASDGDLLSYGKDGNVLKKLTATEKAIQRANAQHNLGLDTTQIGSDLLREKQLGFTGTRTFIALRDKYAVIHKKPAAFAAVPDIQLNSLKLSRNFTTRRFAENVNKRYQACMGQKQ